MSHQMTVQFSKEMKSLMMADLKTRYPAVLSHLLDKCSYLDPTFCCTYLVN